MHYSGRVRRCAGGPSLHVHVTCIYRRNVVRYSSSVWPTVACHVVVVYALRYSARSTRTRERAAPSGHDNFDWDMHMGHTSHTLLYEWRVYCKKGKTNTKRDHVSGYQQSKRAVKSAESRGTCSVLGTCERKVNTRSGFGLRTRTIRKLYGFMLSRIGSIHAWHAASNKVPRAR